MLADGDGNFADSFDAGNQPVTAFNPANTGVLYLGIESEQINEFP